MSKEYKLKMELERIELSEAELSEVQDPYRFQAKYFKDVNREEERKKIDGKYFWLSGVRMSNGNAIQRNQPPIEVIFVNQQGQEGFRAISKTRDPLSKKVKLYDNAGNGLHICETKLQAQYMYNQDLINEIEMMNQRIKEIEYVKDRLVNLEQDLNT